MVLAKQSDDRDLQKKLEMNIVLVSLLVQEQHEVTINKGKSAIPLKHIQAKYQFLLAKEQLLM